MLKFGARYDCNNVCKPLWGPNYFTLQYVCKPLWGPNYFTLQHVCKPLWGPNYLSLVLVAVVDVGVNDGGGHMGVGGGAEGLSVVLLYGQRAGGGLGSGSGLAPG